MLYIIKPPRKRKRNKKETKRNKKNKMQLTTNEIFNPDNMIFSKATENKIPKSTMSYYRSMIRIKHPDGTTGD